MKDLLDTLREAGVLHAKLSESGALLEVTFAHAMPPAVEPSDDEPARESPLKRSARALLAPVPTKEAANV